jgi:flagellar biosynthesis protein FlhB
VAGEKTEDPTAKKKGEARKEGNIPKTPDLVTWTQLLVGAILLKAAAGKAGQLVERTFVNGAQIIADPVEVKPALQLLGNALGGMMTVMMPLVIAMAVIGIAGNLAQSGLKPNFHKLKPKFNRLNVFKGLKQMVAPQSAWEAVKSIIKLALLGELGRRTIMDIVPQLLVPGGMPLPEMVGLTVTSTMTFVRNVALLGLVIAAIDYALARKRINKKLKMSKQEIKDEGKQSENPETKARIKSKQFEMSRMRMMADVFKADVIITNPTHFAVALKYDPSRGAPRVIAKGAGELALKIRKIADKERVPMVEDVPLARTLYKACDIGDEIPGELYEAVARVLAFIFALRQRGVAAGHHSGARSGLSEELDLPRQPKRAGTRRAS